MGFSKWRSAQKVIDGGHFEPTPEEIEEEQQTKLDAIALYVGWAMILIGTFIWAYGDIIGGGHDAQSIIAPGLREYLRGRS
jgi:hypothetical protein